MSTKLRCFIGAASIVIFVDLLIIGMKIFDGNYNLTAECVIGLVGFAAIDGCGVIGLYRELKNRRRKKQ